ncbi:MAG: hypothetical protein CMP59_13090 [Flavobacteriales bacterium]|nr:hypothetical protein [Flavobacteriales bacterium]|tara:strand:- start:1596 stop:2258 length:663 start_codon:yes stop_codon:yes gene_type:complete
MGFLRAFGFTCLILLLYSCKEETRVNEVQGFVYSDCSTPIANTEVAFKINPGQSFSETIIMASDVTDQNGYFRFTYELEEVKKGRADLIVVRESSYETIIEAVPLNKDHDLKGFLINQSDVIFTLTGPRVYQATDTLFYGIQGGEEYLWVQPSTGAMDTIYSRIGNRFEANQWKTFYYGIGSTEFALSKEALGIKDSSYNHVSLQIFGCSDTKTFNLYIE